ncbi:MAG: LuxR C-terminal-related transcriptional regulator [Acidimicrobiales bacterium]
MTSTTPGEEAGPLGIDALTTPRDALARHDWRAAHEAAVAAAPLTGAAEAERLDLLAEASWWLGRLVECTEAREQAHRIFDDLGDARRAGQCAVWLYEHYGMQGRPTIAGAWLRRARRSLVEHPDSPEYHALLLREVEVIHGEGRLEEATEVARHVVDVSRQQQWRNLEAEALQALGRLLIDRGEVADGLAQLDEAMLYAVEGRLGPYATGKVYCSLVTACEELGDMRRAAEWTEATAKWAQQHPFTIFPGICRVHRAAALGWRGELAVAEQEADKACTELIDIHVPNAAAAYATVGDIRRRLGDLDGAGRAFASAEELCGRPCGGLALLQLSDGRSDLAVRTIQRALEEQPWNRLARVELLPAQVEIAVEVGDLATATEALRELESVGEDFDVVWVGAAAESARARIQLAEGDLDAACVTARRAVERWQALEVPYEEATARVLLARGLRACGDEGAAAVAFDAAAAMFADLGARLDLAEFDGRLVPEPAPAGLTGREVEVLRLVAAGCTNKGIAAELQVSSKTVSRHLSNIFSKIGVSSRSAATAFAFEHHLVDARR